MTGPTPILGISLLSEAPAAPDAHPPRTALEQAMVDIWRQVLPAQAISPDSDFFELGGDSLLATQIAARVRQVLGVELDLLALLDLPTPAIMAAQVETALRQGQPAPGPRLAPAARGGSLPLSFTQERMWFIQQLEPLSAAYNIAAAVRLRGEVDLAALDSAFSALVQRHDSLHTVFGLVAGQPRQIVADAQPFHAAFVAVDGPLSAAQPLLDQAAQAPFDLARGPLLRAAVYRLGADDHVLLIMLHHIISDAWSLGVLSRELLALYQATRHGQAASLPALPIQFADFAAWQREAMAGPALERELAYWRRKLEGLPPLELPLDQPRPATQRYRGALERADLDPALLRTLRRLSQQAGATLSMTLLAAFQVLLQRCTGQDDFAVALPIANRRDVALEGLIGAFVNTLVLRADLSGAPTFGEALARTRQSALEAYAHQDMPFARLVAELNPERRLSHNPLVQVMFNHINVPLPTLPPGELAAKTVELDRGAAQFDLTLTVLDLPGREQLSLEYDTDLFEPDTARRFLRHYLNLLRAIAADPARPVAALPLLDPAERHQLLVAWNDTARPYPDQSLAELFEAQAERTPDAPALLAGEQSLSCRALNERANQIGHHLRGLGVGPGALVGVCLDRGFDQVAALLAALKAGAAYLPLDPAYPAERLRFMLADSGAAAVLTTSQCSARLAGGAPADSNGPPPFSLIALDEAAGQLAAHSRANLGLRVGLDAPAYLIYTSGSSGQPKGVLAPHRGAVNHCQWVWDNYPYAPGEVAAQRTSLNFVDAVAEIFAPLLLGVPLALIPEPVGRDPARLVDELARQGVTRLIVLPSLLRAMLRAEPCLGCRLPRLALLVAGGESLDAPLLEQCQAALPGVTLLNWYGSSEVAGDVTSFDCRGPRPAGVVPIGRPLANTQVYVLEAATLEPAPIGVAGDLYAGGAGLALGYANRPDLTAERFVANPFSQQPGARLYRMGDRARFLPDGNLLYLGRHDRQVKVRGVRVELDEVQAQLALHPALEAVVVCARERHPGAGAELAAYYVARPGAAVTPLELRRHLAGLLPESMLPAWLVALAELPLLPNGKVNLRALPDPSPAQRRPESGESVPAHTQLELDLARLWAHSLELPQMGVTDNFFELGGHSLLAASLFASLKEQLGLDLPLSLLFRAPTVAGLAAAIVQSGQAPPGLASLVPIKAAGTRPPFFCVHPLGGGVADYAALAGHLHPQQPFYGLRAKGLDDERFQSSPLEALAADYLAEIRLLQPAGPYRLGGYSSGGLIAFEMARQLASAGEGVALVALLDSYAPGGPGGAWLRREALRNLAASLPHWLGDLSRLERQELLARLRRRWPASRRARQPLTAGDYLGQAQLAGLPAKHRAFIDAHWQALAAYRPRPFAGRVTLFRAQAQALSRATDPDKGWRALALGGVDIREFPGSHHTLLSEPWAAGLARALQARLDELDRD